MPKGSGPLLRLREGLAGKEKAVQYKCEHKYIKLILELEGKVLTRKELDKIIEDLQVDIERRRITKDSPFKFEINFSYLF